MKSLALCLLLLAGLGCTNLQPVGPLAARAKKKAPTMKDIDDQEVRMVTAPKPPPPAILIESDDVTAESAAAAAEKLANEMEYDTKAIPARKKTSEVSRYKSGVKIQ